MIIVSGTRLGGILFSSLGLIAGQPLNVGAGSIVSIDIDTPHLGYIQIDGTLKSDGTNKTLWGTGIGISSTGALETGTTGNSTNFNIVLDGAYVPLTMGAAVNGLQSATNPGLSRGIMIDPGGRIDLHGVIPTNLSTQLNADAVATATVLTTAIATGWASTDAILVSNTEFPIVAAFPALNRVRTTELFQLNTTPVGTTLTLPAPGLAWDKWGSLQYPVDVAVTGKNFAKVQNTFSAFKASVDVPTVVDERATIINLTRGINISCPNDSDWTTHGHGVHIMWMSSGSTIPTVRIDGVAIRRGGQRGALGRYPFHAHMGSYNAATGVYTVDHPNNYVKNCVVWDSENRAYTCHGTNGMTWQNNVGYNFKGHGLFTEDGSEIRNVFSGNMLLGARAPSAGTAMPGGFSSLSGNGTTATVNWTAHGLWSGQVITCTGASISGFNVRRQTVVVINANQFTYDCIGTGTPTGMSFTYGDDTIKLHDQFASNIWYSNPNNYLDNNYTSDSLSGDLNINPLTGSGIWCSFGDRCTGSSHLVALDPHRTDILSFTGNTAHSNYGAGLRIMNAVSDELGTPDSSTTDAGKYIPGLGLDIRTNKLWKNTLGAYRNAVGVTKYKSWVTVDNGNLNGGDFSGSTNNGGLSTDHLICGESLNNAVPTGPDTIYPHAGFIPYHGTIFFQNCSFVNLPYAAPVFNGGQDKGFGGGANCGGTDGYDQPGIDLTNGHNTGHKYLASHPGPIAVPIDLDGRAIDGTGFARHYSIAAIQQDLDGKFGTAGKFVMPITPGTGLVDDRYLSGATNVADGPTSGTVVCKTTDTRFFGLGNSDAIHVVSDSQAANLTYAGAPPLRITRQALVGGATIGTPQVIMKGESGGSLLAFGTYRGFAVQAGGRYLIEFTDGTNSIAVPSTYLYWEICNANTIGDFVVLGFPWANGSTPRICMGNTFSNESQTFPDTINAGSNLTQNTFASAADVTAKRAIIPNTAAAGGTNDLKIQAVAADTTGQTFFRDTINNTLWVRYTLPPAQAYPANPDPHGTGFAFYDAQKINIKV